MAKRVFIILTLMAFAATTAAYAQDSQWKGRLRLGGIYKDETGDRSAMQETYNIHDGFNVSSVYLDGRFSPKSYLKLDLTDFSLDNRRGYLEYRNPGLFRVYSTYTQSQQVFDADRVTESERKNFFVTARVTPSSLWDIEADYRLLNRTGDRMGYPADSMETWLGQKYDYNHHYGRLAAQIKTDVASGTVALQGSKVADNENDFNDREGGVVSANLFLPGLYVDRLTHVLRGSIGQSEQTTSATKFKMYTGQYTGILDLVRGLQFKYRFYASRVDDEARIDAEGTSNNTDNFIHDLDLVYRDKWGSVSGGYGWEALDDDYAVTTYNNFRGALYLRTPDNKVSGNVRYASRDKEDKEKQTLLMDTELTRIGAKVDVRPMDDLVVGASFKSRERELNDISARAEGQIIGVYGRWKYDYDSSLGDLETKIWANYNYADDEYTNRTGEGYNAESNFVTGKIGVEWERKLDLGAGVTYMEIKKDLDIEKSTLFFWAGYTFVERWEVRAKYNVYNYDDFILTDRFYTANIVWFDVGYNFEVN
jgi:hypothetical protein